MKMTRKLIPAFVMLIVSAIMLSTASYAWFASNLDVDATNMKVNVNSDVRFLQISATSKDEGYSDSVKIPDATAPELELVHATVGAHATPTYANNTNAIAWEIGTSNDSGSANTGSLLTPITKDLSNYAYTKDFWIKASDGSVQLQNLKISGVTITGGNNSLQPAMRVLAVGKDGVQLWSVREGALVTDPNHDTALLTTITTGKTDDQKVTIYIYFDGADEIAYTDALANTEDLVVTVAFSAS